MRRGACASEGPWQGSGSRHDAGEDIAMLRSACCSLLVIATAAAADAPAPAPAHDWPRVVGEVLVGTAGFEPGVAAEWTFDLGTLVRVRPEVILNLDDLPGLAVSATVPVASGSLPATQSLWIGPRLVFHNDRYDGGKRDGDLAYGFGAEAMALYTFAIIPEQPGRHSIELIGALGLVDHHDDTDISLTIGAGYGFKF
jgi:hypothetical protein